MVFNKQNFKQFAQGGMMVYGATRPSMYTGNRYNRSRSYTTVIQRRRQPQARSYSLKKTIRATQPAKHCPINDATATLTHNTLLTLGPSQFISVGSGRDQRIGDAIHTLALKINGIVTSVAGSTASTQFRIITLWSGEEYTSAANFASGLGNSEIFVNSGLAWQPNAITNPKAVTVLDDRTIVLNNSITGVADLESFNYTVPCDTDFDYQTATSVFGKNRNLYVVVVGSIVGGISGTTPAGSATISMDLIFK